MVVDCAYATCLEGMLKIWMPQAHGSLLWLKRGPEVLDSCLMSAAVVLLSVIVDQHPDTPACLRFCMYTCWVRGSI